MDSEAVRSTLAQVSLASLAIGRAIGFLFGSIRSRSPRTAFRSST
jgi:hypothetical protein